MNQNDKAKLFKSFHEKDSTVLLYNGWDAGSAKALVEAGAKAVATSSWSVAEAQGYRDGESLPFDLLKTILTRIVQSVDVPVSGDFEGGYSDDDKKLHANIASLMETGIVGINFEDRVVKGTGLYSVERQAKRVATIRAAAEEAGLDLFINARTDLFFQKGDPAQYVDEAIVRAKAFADAGASGLFIPGLTDAALIKRIALSTTLPVNVMIMDGMPSVERLKDAGVRRISWGPIPFINAFNLVRSEAKKIFATA